MHQRKHAPLGFQLCPHLWQFRKEGAPFLPDQEPAIKMACFRVLVLEALAVRRHLWIWVPGSPTPGVRSVLGAPKGQAGQDVGPELGGGHQLPRLVLRRVPRRGLFLNPGRRFHATDQSVTDPGEIGHNGSKIIK